MFLLFILLLFLVLLVLLVFLGFLIFLTLFYLTAVCDANLQSNHINSQSMAWL